MSRQVYEQIRQILGLGIEPKDLSFIQISLRGIIVFVVSLLMVRVSNRRFLSRMSAFDAILGFILASMLARALKWIRVLLSNPGGGVCFGGFSRVDRTLGFLVGSIREFGKGQSRRDCEGRTIGQKDDDPSRDFRKGSARGGPVERTGIAGRGDSLGNVGT